MNRVLKKMTTSKNRRRGKNTERALAKRLNGKRIGILGKQDIEHSFWSIEVKNRQRFSGEAFMLQAVRNCPEGKTPLVIVHLHGRRHCDDFVIMRLRDFENYLGKIRTKGDFENEQ